MPEGLGGPERALGQRAEDSGIDSTREIVPSPKPTVIVVIQPSSTSADDSATTNELGSSARAGSSPVRWYDSSTVAVFRSSAMNTQTASPTGSSGCSTRGLTNASTSAIRMSLA